jgi:hypothetical protein
LTIQNIDQSVGTDGLFDYTTFSCKSKKRALVFIRIILNHNQMLELHKIFSTVSEIYPDRSDSLYIPSMEVE